MTSDKRKPTVIGIDLATKPDQTALQLPCGTVLTGDDAIFEWKLQQSKREIARAFGVPLRLVR